MELAGTYKLFKELELPLLEVLTQMECEGINLDTSFLKKLSNKRYDVIGKSDYIIINNEGNLEFWDKQGYFLTCKSGISE